MPPFNFNQKNTTTFRVDVTLSKPENQAEIDFLIQKFFRDVPEATLLKLAKKLRKDPNVLTKLLNNPLVNLYI